jgi:hypothetical protein
MEAPMITIRLEPQQFTALRTGFDAAASDPDAPIDPTLIADVQSALAEARATALPGLPVLVTLQSTAELDTLGVCFEVGGEGHPGVTDDQLDSIVALVEQAAQQVAN